MPNTCLPCVILALSGLGYTFLLCAATGRVPQKIATIALITTKLAFNALTAKFRFIASPPNCVVSKKVVRSWHTDTRPHHAVHMPPRAKLQKQIARCRELRSVRQ